MDMKLDAKQLEEKLIKIVAEKLNIEEKNKTPCCEKKDWRC